MKMPILPSQIAQRGSASPVTPGLSSSDWATSIEWSKASGQRGTRLQPTRRLGANHHAQRDACGYRYLSRTTSLTVVPLTSLVPALGDSLITTRTAPTTTLPDVV